MNNSNISGFGKIITRLINRENLSRQEAFQAFSTILNNETTEIQQGAFLAAMAAKGETKEEIAACWEAIYEQDTVKAAPNINRPIVENSGTGMDSFKTFNISTCASIIAASQGVAMARHGARALTSLCGTVDMAEALGVDVECGPEIAVKSLEQSGLALFNGMSPTIHPNALGRILSQIAFGSTLNIAASLASPVKAEIGVRGVYAKEMIRPVIEVMKEIGYKKALVINGEIDRQNQSMDEASISGTTSCAELNEDGSINEFSFRPEEAGIKTCLPDDLRPTKDIGEETKKMIALLTGDLKNNRVEAAALNAGLIFYATGDAKTIKEGTSMAKEVINSGKAMTTLNQWVKFQNRDAEAGLNKLNAIRIN